MAGDNYQRAYDAIEREFDIADLDADAITSYLTAGRIGPHKIKYGFDKKGRQRERMSDGVSSRGVSKIRDFADDIAEAGRIYKDAKDAQDIDTLNNLSRKAAGLKYIKYSRDHQSQLDSIITSRREFFTKNDYSQIKNRLNKTEDYDELKSVRKEAERLDDSIKEKDALINSIDVKMNNISKELSTITEERRTARLEQERQEKELSRIESRIENARDLTTLDRLDRQLSDLDIDTSNAQSLLDGQRESVRISNVEYNPDF